MDPNANLQEQYEIAERLLGGGGSARSRALDALRLAELVGALDGWISKGGALPTTWAMSRRSRRALKARARIERLRGRALEKQVVDLQIAREALHDHAHQLYDAAVAALRWFRFYVGPGMDLDLIETLENACALYETRYPEDDDEEAD